MIQRACPSLGTPSQGELVVGPNETKTLLYKLWLLYTSNENVNSAFEMAGPAFANVETLTAGCNFNNEVEITKSNVNGLVNSAAGGYDTDEFQANIPYSVTAAWTGVPVNTVTSGTGQTLNVSTSPLSNLIQQGAWRSNMTINFNAPAITNKGLVAGNYSGTTTLVLRAVSARGLTPG